MQSEPHPQGQPGRDHHDLRGDGGRDDGDGGPATEATLRLTGDPASLAIDASGNIYIGDSGNHVIRVVDPSGIISTLEVAASPGESPRLPPTDCPTPLASGSIATVVGTGSRASRATRATADPRWRRSCR